ncbi:GTP-binding protein [filamentous cyanobacterium LEGE 11480]|uniref:GTP-binding protein n=1 Tax=Romeriopsis navalis LEGE 11480 TaxID=2777977 RepID=A0A928Z2D4_9CYAN|nr:GTP-binding protein [Romeriopsis navalis]MBE9028922.1 GTP-binding protein [Romeriopsis navalis LEGE 11480]
MLESLDGVRNQKLPVTIITGFLGSGKTTLLNRILQNRQDLKVAVLVNEFGDINIDSQLLMTVGEDMVELSNGCICCTINDSLANTVYEVLARPEKLDYLIVETTGVADPLPIALTFLGSELRDLTYVDGILTVVDAENFSLKQGEAAVKQIMYGDIALLNKTDLVTTDRLGKVETQIHETKEGARILHMQHGEVPLPLILDVKLAQSENYPLEITETENQPKPRHLQNDGYLSVSFQSKRPFSLRKFQHFLDNQLPVNIYRMKGILWFEESPARHVFQLSGRRFHLDDSTWEDQPSNQLVCIGHKINPIEIQQYLANCLA